MGKSKIMTQAKKSKAVKAEMEDEAKGFIVYLIGNLDNKIAAVRDELKGYIKQLEYLKDIRERI